MSGLDGFLLTRLLRGVTGQDGKTLYGECISTHTPLARRDVNAGTQVEVLEISTHTPLARRDSSVEM